MTAPLLLYRMRKDYIKMDKITNIILHFPQNLFFNLKSLIELLIYCYTVLRANDCNNIENTSLHNMEYDEIRPINSLI